MAFFKATAALRLQRRYATAKCRMSTWVLSSLGSIACADNVMVTRSSMAPLFGTPSKKMKGAWVSSAMVGLRACGRPGFLASVK